MDYRLLELHFAQLSEAWQESKYNNYSDAEKRSYHNHLEEIFIVLSEGAFSKFNENELGERKRIIDFFFTSLKFLDGSVLNAIPFELVKCLEDALEDWIDGDSNYIIVTSLVGDMLGFSFEPRLAFDEEVYRIIESVCKVSFESRLIQINLPKSLARDYLANVVLYHELGHFVDLSFSFSSALCMELVEAINNQKMNSDEFKDLQLFFPYLIELTSQKPNQSIISQIPVILERHIAEYFCDLFASQYIGRCSSYYLNYVAGTNDTTSSHPSTANRNDLVDKFLKGDESTYTLNKIKSTVPKVVNKRLEIRYSEFDSSDFIDIIPYDVRDSSQLHYLFTYGWDIWLNKRGEIQKRNNMQFSLNGKKAYGIINNLIEKSIGNYIVQTNWQKNKDVSGSE